MRKDVFDCIIIGCGPAGMSAAIQLKRLSKSFLLFEKDNVGGLLLNANKVENYLGYESINGEGLVENFRKQLLIHNIDVLNEKIVLVDKKEDVFVLGSEKGVVYNSRSVVIATGTIPRKLDVVEKKHDNVFYEVKELYDMKDTKKIAVIGGGDAAFDYSLNLDKRGHAVYLFVRDMKAKCLDLLNKRISGSSVIVEYAVDIDNLDLSRFDMVLIAIGRETVIPELKCPNDVSGLFFAGDVVNDIYRQVSIASGDGLKTAMKVERYLDDFEGN